MTGEEHMSAAATEERIAWMEAQINYLQARVIRLNAEIRIRDQRITEAEEPRREVFTNSGEGE